MPVLKTITGMSKKSFLRIFRTIFSKKPCLQVIHCSFCVLFVFLICHLFQINVNKPKYNNNIYKLYRYLSFFGIL